METDHVTQTWGTKTVKENRQEFADNGKRTELVPEIPVRGKQVTQTKPRDEGNLGTVPRDQGGKEKTGKIRKREVGPRDPIPEVVQTPQ